MQFDLHIDELKTQAGQNHGPDAMHSFPVVKFQDLNRRA